MRPPAELLTKLMHQKPLLEWDTVVKLWGDVSKCHDMACVQLGVTQKHQKKYYNKKTYGIILKPGEKVCLKPDESQAGTLTKLHNE